MARVTQVSRVGWIKRPNDPTLGNPTTVERFLTRDSGHLSVVPLGNGRAIGRPLFRRLFNDFWPRAEPGEDPARAVYICLYIMPDQCRSWPAATRRGPDDSG